MENLHTFLARYPPFEGVGPATLETLVAEAERHSFKAGDEALVEDGPPSPGLWVVLTGSMGLLHEGEEIQVLEPGECRPPLASDRDAARVHRQRTGAVDLCADR